MNKITLWKAVLIYKVASRDLYWNNVNNRSSLWLQTLHIEFQVLWEKPRLPKNNQQMSFT